MEVIELLENSKSDFVSKLIKRGTENAVLPDGRKGARKITTLSKFKTSLDNLMNDLTLCDLHYVRCLKPNDLSKPGKLI